MDQWRRAPLYWITWACLATGCTALPAIQPPALAVSGSDPVPRPQPAALSPSQPTWTKTAEPLTGPQKAKVCITTAESLAQAGHYAQAAEQYELARQHDPKSANVSRRLAVLYDKAKQHDKALTEYKIALAQSPRDPDLLNDIGYCCFQRQEYQEAEKYLRQALAIQPDHQRAQGNLGMVLGMQGRMTESLQAFEKVSDAANAHCSLGYVYLLKNRVADARAEYARAATLDPKLEIAQKMLAQLDARSSDSVPALRIEATESKSDGKNRKIASANWTPTKSNHSAELGITLLPPVPSKTAASEAERTH